MEMDIEFQVSSNMDVGDRLSIDSGKVLQLLEIMFIIVYISWHNRLQLIMERVEKIKN